MSVPLRGWFFALAFVSIGLTHQLPASSGKYFQGGKPVILYVCGQSFNLCLYAVDGVAHMFYKVFH